MGDDLRKYEIGIQHIAKLRMRLIVTHPFRRREDENI